MVPSFGVCAPTVPAGFAGYELALAQSERPAHLPERPLHIARIERVTAGAMVASAESVARFGDALFDGRVVTPSSLEQMRTFVPADSAGYDAYGLGIGRRRSPTLGRELWGAVGLFPGFGSGLWHTPRECVPVAGLWNDRTVLESNDLGDALLQAALEQCNAG